MSDTYAATAQAAGSNAVTDTKATLYGSGDGVDWNQYLKDNPDVAAEYQRVNGPGLKYSLGLGGGPHDQGMTPEEFAQWHYNQFGQSEGRAAPGGISGGNGIVGDAKTTATNIVTNATDTQAKNQTDQTSGLDTLLTNSTNAYNTAIDKLISTTNTALDKVTQGNKDLATQTTDAITSLNQNSNDAITRMSAAMQALQAPQARKQPNLIDLFRQNKARMGRGNGSTFLAGPNGTGLPGSNLPIGVNAISGAALSSPSLGA